MVPLATKRFVGLRNVDVILSSNTVRLMLCSCRINNEEHMKRFEKCRERGEREVREGGKWNIVSNEMFAIMSVHLLCKLGHKTTTKQPKWLD